MMRIFRSHDERSRDKILRVGIRLVALSRHLPKRLERHHPFNVSHKPVLGICSNLHGGEHLRQSRPLMAAESAIDGLAGLVVVEDHLQNDMPRCAYLL